MLTYRVPQREIQVVVHLCQGEPLEGCLFVPTDGLGGIAQRLSDRLTEPHNKFFALTGKDGSRLISRDWILRVDVLSADEALLEEDAGAGEPVPMTLRLADGTELDGTVAFAMPPGRQRLIDYFNSLDGFLPLRCRDGLSLVHVRNVIDCACL